MSSIGRDTRLQHTFREVCIHPNPCPHQEHPNSAETLRRKNDERTHSNTGYRDIILIVFPLILLQYCKLLLVLQLIRCGS